MTAWYAAAGQLVATQPSTAAYSRASCWHWQAKSAAAQPMAEAPPAKHDWAHEGMAVRASWAQSVARATVTATAARPEKREKSCDVLMLLYTSRRQAPSYVV